MPAPVVQLGDTEQKDQSDTVQSDTGCDGSKPVWITEGSSVLRHRHSIAISKHHNAASSKRPAADQDEASKKTPSERT